MTLLSLDNIPALQDEVRARVAKHGAIIPAHHPQLPKIQQVANYVGESFGLSQLRSYQMPVQPGAVLRIGTNEKNATAFLMAM